MDATTARFVEFALRSEFAGLAQRTAMPRSARRRCRRYGVSTTGDIGEVLKRFAAYST